MKKTTPLLIVAIAILSVWALTAKKCNKNVAPSGSEPITNRLEYPATTDDDDIVVHLGYTTAYNHKTLTPNWVAYELTRQETEGELKRNDVFAQDEMLKGRQATLEDYKHSGYDRGHLAPAADMKWSEQAMVESFLLTNMCPQLHELNAGDWEKTEKMGRRLAKQYGKVYIVCGPLYSQCQHGTIGPNKVAVPDAFYKAFLIESNNQYAAIGFLMYNTTEYQGLKECSMSVDELEAIIERDLFINLPDDIENDIESKVVKKYWGI